MPRKLVRKKTTLLKKSTLMILISLVLFHVLSNIVWWQLNKAPLPWDQANHTQIAQQLYYCFSSKPFSVDCWSISNYYPIATHLTAVVLFLFTGPSGFAAQFIGTFYFVLAIVGIFFFFRESTKNYRLALITTAIASFLPVIADVSRYLMTDMPLLAFTFWSMYFLRKADGFTKLKPTLIAFALAGLAVFTKWYGAFYLVVPFLWELVVARDHLFSKKKAVQTWRNILLGSGLAVLIISPWYVVNLKTMIEQTLFYSGADDSQAKNLLSFKALTWYVMLAFKYQLFPWLFGLLVAGIGLFVSTEKKKWWLWYVLVFVVAEYVIFTFFGNKAIRYSFQLVVFYSFFIAYLLDWLLQKYQRVGQIITGIVFAYVLFFYTTLSFEWPVHEYRYVSNIPLLGWTELINISDDPIKGVNPNHWPVDEVVDDLYQLSEKEPGYKILVLIDYPHFNTSNMLVSMLEKRAAGYIPFQLEGPETRLAEIDAYGVETYLDNYDYFLVTTNEVGHDWHRGVFGRNKAQQYIFANLELYDQVSSYQFPLHDLLPAIIKGQDLPGNRLVRQKVCQKQTCDQFLLLKKKAPNESEL